jgi:hypothetical protein
LPRILPFFLCAKMIAWLHRRRRRRRRRAVYDITLYVYVISLAGTSCETI